MIAALYVMEDGPYSRLENIELWGIRYDARNYKGPHKVIAHPPCERWGRYWSGGPSIARSPQRRLLGDDGGCFAHALWCVRSFGGILEHPEGSHAFRYYGLPIPKQSGGWTEVDAYGGRSCCVAQGYYGHKAQKLTWLYGKNIDFKELNWGKKQGMQRLEDGFHSKEERNKLSKSGICQRITQRQMLETPKKFRDLLLSMVREK